MENLIRDLSFWFGGWTLLITGITTWVSSLISKKIFTSWERKNQFDLEKLKSDLNKTNFQLEEISRIISTNQSIVQSKRIDALESLWQAIIKLRESFTSVIFFFIILAPSEYKDFISDPKKSFVKDINDEFIVKVIQEYKYIENLRPLIGENLWGLFFIYRAFLGQLAFIIINIKDGKDINNWKNDKDIFKLLKLIIPSEENDSITKNNFDLNDVLNIIEGKILKEIHEFLSGKRTSFESIKGSIEINNLLNQEFQTYSQGTNYLKYMKNLDSD